MTALFGDRTAAARSVLPALAAYRGRTDVMVVGLARGGAVPAAVIAAELGCRWDIAVVRKLGAPGHPELAVGAVTADQLVLNDDLVTALAVSPAELTAMIEQERRELHRREGTYREGRAPTPVDGRTVLLVDDGMATGATMRAAALAMRGAGAARVVVAVPVAPYRIGDEFALVAEEFICPRTPRDFRAVGLYYRDFRQVDDAEVRALLAKR